MVSTRLLRGSFLRCRKLEARNFDAQIDFFGYVPKSTVQSGISTKMLFAKAHMFSLKTKLIEVSLTVPTTEGLIVELDGECRKSGECGWVDKGIGSWKLNAFHCRRLRGLPRCIGLCGRVLHEWPQTRV